MFASFERNFTFLENNFQRKLPPIKCILTSIPFWALFFLQFGHMWSFYFLLVAAPKYLNEVNFNGNSFESHFVHSFLLSFVVQVLKFDLTNSGFLASAPYLSRFCCGLVFGSISDYLIKHKMLSVTRIRKSFSIFCELICFICIKTILNAFCMENIHFHFHWFSSYFTGFIVVWITFC